MGGHNSKKTVEHYKTIVDNHTTVNNEASFATKIQKSEKTFTDKRKGDRANGESGDFSGSQNTGLRCIGLKPGDPACKHLMLVNLNDAQIVNLENYYEP